MAKRNTELPDDFPITTAMRAWADEKVPTLDVDYYHDYFCEHWGQGQKKRDWVKAWMTWMRRTNDGTAPGLYGSDDRRIVRKRPKPVPQANLPLKQLSSYEQAWQRMDELREEAIKAGMTMVEARQKSVDELKRYIVRHNPYRKRGD